jgi:uncharacterized protein YjbI with pentapeptide repeats
MPQNDYGNPTSPFTGTQLNNRLRDWRDALHSLHRGTSRPTYAVAGMLWLQEISSTEWRLQLYDGDTDIRLGTINPTANTFTPAGVTGFAPLTGATFTGPVIVPNATADGHALNRVTADARYAQLTGAAFSGSVVVPNATADGHALNRVTADGRYAQLTGAAFTGAVTLPASDPTNANHAARKAYVDAGDVWVKLADAPISNSTIIDVTGFSLQNYRVVQVLLLGAQLSSSSSSATTAQVYRNGSLVNTGYTFVRTAAGASTIAASTTSNAANLIITWTLGANTDPMRATIILAQSSNSANVLFEVFNSFFDSQPLLLSHRVSGAVTGGSGWVDGIRITAPAAFQNNVGRIVVLGLKP